MDTLSAADRSEVMRRVLGKNTGPEMIVRSIVHGMGFRYRLHGRELPGNPDLVFPSRRKVIFVHGCFWHGHCCRHGRNRPSSHTAYWIPKLDRNKRRDKTNRARLTRLGWKTLVIWECQLKRDAALDSRIARFLADDDE